VGRYNEFDQLRVAGVRHADTKGYAYSREDVDARSLANVYAQYLGQVFTHEMKPLEVEILVAELDPVGAAHQLFHIAYDGTVADEQRFTVLGGEADAITHRMAAKFRPGWSLGEAVVACVASLSGPTRTLRADDLELAVLEHGPWRRAFRRVPDDEVTELLARGEPPEVAAARPPRAEGESTPGPVDRSGDDTGDLPGDDA
jgi:proteasome alpha subunit